MTELPSDVLALGVGGNVGSETEIVDRFQRARDALGQLGQVRSAPLYRSAPIGPAQPDYLNTAIRIRVADLTPPELASTIVELERMLGRRRELEVRWGPRPIDLDVLLWGTRVLASPELDVPHPRLCDRRFAIQPLIDLFGDALVVPGTSRELGAIERGLRDQPLDVIAADW